MRLLMAAIINKQKKKIKQEKKRKISRLLSRRLGWKRDTFAEAHHRKKENEERTSFFPPFFQANLERTFFLLVRTENRTPLDLIAFCFYWFGWQYRLVVKEN